MRWPPEARRRSPPEKNDKTAQGSRAKQPPTSRGGGSGGKTGVVTLCPNYTSNENTDFFAVYFSKHEKAGKSGNGKTVNYSGCAQNIPLQTAIPAATQGYFQRSMAPPHSPFIRSFLRLPSTTHFTRRRHLALTSCVSSSAKV